MQMQSQVAVESTKVSTGEKTKTCKSCFGPFSATNQRQLFCPDCRARRKLESNRGRKQRYRQKHADEIRTKNRLRAARDREKKHQHLSPQELEVLLRDPDQARNESEIICLSCGRRGLQALRGHIRVYHQLTEHEYKDKFSIPQHAPLVSMEDERRARKNKDLPGLFVAVPSYVSQSEVLSRVPRS